MILYTLIGLEIIKLKGKFKLISNDRIPLGSIYNNSFDKPNNNVATKTVKVNAKSEPQDTEQFSINNTPAFQSHPSNSITLNLPKQSPISFRHYILMPLIFFIVLLATWIPLTVNRVYAFVDPGYVSYPLLVAVGAMGSLRGFWNGILFITMGMKGWKKQKRLKRGTFTIKVCEIIQLDLQPIDCLACPSLVKLPDK